MPTQWFYSLEGQNARPLHCPRNEEFGFHRTDSAYLQSEEEPPDENGVGRNVKGLFLPAAT